MSSVKDKERGLIIFHAGSLDIPFSKIEREFKAIHPELYISRHGGGSTKLAKMIAESKDSADILASADYQVIDDVLVPDSATWNILFATNRLVLCFTEKSKYAGQISGDNWFEILLKSEVKWGHSDPYLDPCGYRSLMLFQLAELYYGEQGLNERLLKNRRAENIKPKSTELVTMLKSGHLDYAWEYMSVAVQHGLNFVELPDQINLGNPEFDNFYSKAKVDLSGDDSAKALRHGKACVYGVTIVKNSPYRAAAEAFLAYMLNPEGGLRILTQEGQTPIIPCRLSSIDMLQQVPEPLRSLLE